MRKVFLRMVCVVLLGFGLGGWALLAQSTPGAADVTQMSLEELSAAQITVSSFGRREEDLWRTPAAVYVITREEIEHASAPTIPGLLRMVPGIQVAQLNASTWAVSARGFNSVFSNKLLVLIDGRTIYAETGSGSQWDQIDLPLDEVERIEVIRGPGAAVWGTNAVSGVVNIITRHARSTQGLKVSALASRLEDAALVRYGGTVGDRVQYAAFGTYLNRLPFVLADGTAAFDGEAMVRGGFVVDWRRNAADRFTVDGDGYGGRQKEQLISTVDLANGPLREDHESLAGGHVLGRWKHEEAGEQTELQVFVDDQARHELSAYVRTRTLSADFQDHRTTGGRNDLVWGAGFRLTADDADGSLVRGTTDEVRNYLVDGFAQDEVAMWGRRLTLTAGSKIQEGTLAGIQLQPSARVLYAPGPGVSVWAAISRAVVAPSLQDTRYSIPVSLGKFQGLPLTGELTGNPGYLPENVIAYETGARTRLGRTVALDTAAFYNSNRRIQSINAMAPVPVAGTQPSWLSTLLYTNWFEAHSVGVETNLTWKPARTLSVQTSYTWMQSRTRALASGAVYLLDQWNTPRHTASATAFWQASRRWWASGFVSFVDRLTPSVGLLVLQPANGSPSITPAYTRVDVHAARTLPHGLQLEAGGTNLLTPRHLEFPSNTSFSQAAYVPRSGFLKVNWSF